MESQNRTEGLSYQYFGRITDNKHQYNQKRITYDTNTKGCPQSYDEICFQNNLNYNSLYKTQISSNCYQYHPRQSFKQETYQGLMQNSFSYQASEMKIIKSLFNISIASTLIMNTLYEILSIYIILNIPQCSIITRINFVKTVLFLSIFLFSVNKNGSIQAYSKVCLAISIVYQIIEIAVGVTFSLYFSNGQKSVDIIVIAAIIFPVIFGLYILGSSVIVILLISISCRLKKLLNVHPVNLII